MPDLVTAAATSILVGGGDHGDARSKQKRRMMKRTRRKRRVQKPTYQRKGHGVMESRRQVKILVGAFTDDVQTRSDKGL